MIYLPDIASIFYDGGDLGKVSDPLELDLSGKEDVKIHKIPSNPP